MKPAAFIAGLALAILLPLAAAAQDKLRVVYHVSEIEKVAFALGNIANHIEGVGGPENVEIALVAHGPALKAFHELEAQPRISERVAALRGAGVHFEACGNTMAAQGVELDDLLAGFFKLDKGGVVRLAELQSQGWLYIRP